MATSTICGLVGDEDLYLPIALDSVTTVHHSAVAQAASSSGSRVDRPCIKGTSEVEELTSTVREGCFTGMLGKDL